MYKYLNNQNESESESGNSDNGASSTVVDRPPVLEKKPEDTTQKPPMYSVCLVNDHTTPMEAVMVALTKVFNKSDADAMKMLMNLHTGRDSKGCVGIYSKDMADTKAQQGHEAAAALMTKMKVSWPCQLTFLVEPETDAS